MSLKEFSWFQKDINLRLYLQLSEKIEMENKAETLL